MNNGGGVVEIGGESERCMPAGGAGLLALEPGAQTVCVEDVVAGQLLQTAAHLLPAHGTQIVREFCRVRVSEHRVQVPAHTYTPGSHVKISQVKISQVKIS